MRFAPLVPKPKPSPLGSRKTQRKPNSHLSAMPNFRDEAELASLDAVPTGIMTKLEIGSASDTLERQADIIADRVMRTPTRSTEAPDAAGLELDSELELEPELIEAPAFSAFAGATALPGTSNFVAQRKCASCEVEDDDVQRTFAEPPVQRACASCEAEEDDVQRAFADSLLQRTCATCETEEDEQIMRDPAAGQRGGPASDDFSARVHERMRNGGTRLSSHARSFLEPRLGTDLEQLHVHTDAPSGRLARSINAKAFTLKDHLFFAPGQFQPHTHAGMRLLAHEVAHTLQGPSRGKTLPIDSANFAKSTGRFSPPTRRGGGRPLTTALQNELAEDFDLDLDLVRIHDGSASSRAVNRLQTRALTLGTDIHIDPRRVTLSSEDGRSLLRHELTHVQQYLNGELQGSGAGLELAEPDSDTEKHARVVADGVAPVPRPKSPAVPLASPKVISREDPEVAGSTWSSTPISLRGQTVFSPSAGLANFIESKGQHGALVHVSLGPYAKGRIRIAERYSAMERLAADHMGVDISGPAYEFYTPSIIESSIPFDHPDLPPYAARLYIRIGDRNEISGGLYLTDDARFSAGVVPPHTLSSMKILGGDGLEELVVLDGLRELTASDMTNEIRHGELDFQVRKFSFETGSAEHEVDPETGEPGPRVTGSGALRISSEEIDIDAAVNVGVKGIKQPFAQLELDESSGELVGSQEYDFELGPVAGKVQATFVNGNYELLGYAHGDFDIGGVTSSGAITVMLTSQANANAKMAALLEPYGLGQVDFYGSHGDPREPRLMGWGELSFAFNDGKLSGTALAVADDGGNLTAAGKLIPAMTFPLFKPRKIGATEPLMRELKYDVWGNRLLAGVVATVSAAVQGGWGIGEGKIGNFELTGALSTNPKIGRQLAVSGRGTLPAFAMFEVDLSIDLDAEVLTVTVAGGSLDFTATAYLTTMAALDFGAAAVDGASEQPAEGEVLDNTVQGLNEEGLAIRFVGGLDLAAALNFRLRGEASARIGEKPKKNAEKQEKPKRWSVEWDLLDKVYEVGSGSMKANFSQILGDEDVSFNMLEHQMGLGTSEDGAEDPSIAEEELEVFTNKLLAEDDTLAEANSTSEDQLVVEGEPQDYQALAEQAESLSIPVEEVRLEDVESSQKYLVPEDLIERQHVAGENHSVYLAVEPEPEALVASDTQKLQKWLKQQVKGVNEALATANDEDKPALNVRLTRLRRLESLFDALVKDASQVFDFGRWRYDPGERDGDRRLTPQVNFSSDPGQVDAGVTFDDQVYIEQRFERALRDIERFKQRVGEAARDVFGEFEYGTDVIGTIDEYIDDQGTNVPGGKHSKNQFEDFAGGGLCRAPYGDGYVVQVGSNKSDGLLRCADRCVKFETIYVAVLMDDQDAAEMLEFVNSSIGTARDNYREERRKTRDQSFTLNKYLVDNGVCRDVHAVAVVLEARCAGRVPDCVNAQMQHFIEGLPNDQERASYMLADPNGSFLRDAAAMGDSGQQALKSAWTHHVVKNPDDEYKKAIIDIVKTTAHTSKKEAGLTQLRKAPKDQIAAIVESVRRAATEAKPRTLRVTDPWKNPRPDFINSRTEWNKLNPAEPIEARRLRFSQNSASYLFQNNTSIDDTATALAANPDKDAAAQDIPEIDLIFVQDPRSDDPEQGSVYTLSNRRVVAAQMADAKLRFNKMDFEAMKREKEKLKKQRDDQGNLNQEDMKRLKKLEDELKKLSTKNEGTSITITGVPPR